MKKLSKFNQITIKQKLIALIGGQLFIFIIVLIVLFAAFQNILEKNANALVKQTLNTISSNMEIYLNQQIVLSNGLASDSELISLMHSYASTEKEASIGTQVELDMLERMNSFTAMTEGRYNVGIYNINRDSILSTKDSAIAVYEPFLKSIADLDMSNASMGFFVNTDSNDRNPYAEEATITLIRKMSGKLSDNYLFVSSSQHTLIKVIGEIDLWQDTSISITDSNNQLIYQAGKFMNTNESDYITLSQFSTLANWNLHIMIPKHVIMKDVIRIKQITIIVTVGISLILLIFSSWLYMQIINPIKRLTKSMLLVEKGYHYEPIDIKRYDELGFLQQRFNQMIINELNMHEQILQEQLHSKELELKFLQSQVNPHFLYNTLDSIYWVAIENKAHDIGEVVLDLSRYFRLSLSRGKEFVTIRESIEHLDYYLRIQLFRHEGKYRIIWDIDRSVEDYHIMKLMLQPIVENSIIHGMEKSATACQLSISVKKHDDSIVFNIEDTGVGMNLAKLRKLIYEIKMKEGPSTATYGLRNLYQRLNLMYGKDMSFAVSSLPGKGTRVKITIHILRLEAGE